MTSVLRPAAGNEMLQQIALTDSNVGGRTEHQAELLVRTLTSVIAVYNMPRLYLRWTIWYQHLEGALVQCPISGLGEFRGYESLSTAIRRLQ